MCDEITFTRIKQETLKFLEIDKIFVRLKEQGFLDKIYTLIN